MEEILGLDAGDFENVDFAGSDEEPEEAASDGGTAAPALGGGAEASGSSSVGGGVAPAAEGTSSSAITTVVEVREVPSANINFTAVEPSRSESLQASVAENTHGQRVVCSGIGDAAAVVSGAGVFWSHPRTLCAG